MSEDVVIIGAGVIGLSIADELAGEGLSVRVLEAEGVASGASGAAAGMLAPVTEAMADGPLLRNGLESLSAFGALCERLEKETGIDPELERSGLLRIVRSETGRERETARLARLGDALGEFACVEGRRSEDLAVEWLDERALRRESAALAPGIRGAYLVPFEYHLRPPLLSRARAASARLRGATIETGVRAEALLRSGSRVEGVMTSDGVRRADCIVVAAGPWTTGLLDRSGLSGADAKGDSIEPVRGQILSLSGPLPTTKRITNTEGVYFVPKRDGTWIVGATEERVGFDCRVTVAGVEELLGRARRVYPELADATVDRAWSGLRPVKEGEAPWIGPAVLTIEGGPTTGLIVASGHGRNGVLLSPSTARRVRRLIMTGDSFASLSSGSAAG